MITENTATKWAVLPNATHIDQVLRDLNALPEEFWKAPPDRCFNQQLADAYDEVWGRPWRTEWMSAWVSIRIGFHKGIIHVGAQPVALQAILALITMDHSAKYLTMSPERLMIWGELSGDPACVLLLPYVRVRERITANEERRNECLG